MDAKLVSHIRSVNGSVPISGAKNSALLILAATLLAKEPVLLNRVPDIQDVRFMLDVLELLGMKIRWFGPAVVYFDPSDIQYKDLNTEVCGKIRASILFLGVMLGRFSKVSLRLPGGCNLGPRPIDRHIDVLTQLGADFKQMGHSIIASKLKDGASEVSFSNPTVTGTANAILYAVCQDSDVVIKNAALEPEIDDLISFLQALGAKVSRMGGMIAIKGGATLGGCHYDIIPDRIEAGTFLIAGAVLGGKIEVEEVIPQNLDVVLKALQAVGADIRTSDNHISLEMKGRPVAHNIVATEYPGFPTDLQPQWCVLSAISEGESVILDRVHPERFDHMEQLAQLGVKYDSVESGVRIYGVDQLHGSEVYAKNLRSAAALVISGYVAKGQTNIVKISELGRGYPGFFEKIKNLQK